VNGRSLLTYMARRQAHLVSDLILGRRSGGLAPDEGSPQVIFTDRRIRSVGLTLERALAAGLPAVAYDVPTSGTAGASFHGRGAPGTSRIVVDEHQGRLIGATFVGPDVGEWLHAASIAIAGNVPIEALWNAVPAFPTRSEVLAEADGGSRAGAWSARCDVTAIDAHRRQTRSHGRIENPPSQRLEQSCQERRSI
jgi:pyruvate/2-oxoglutarate dehydrogenase complex dihydrolipoamide dehydrogenase (E3) component